MGQVATVGKTHAQHGIARIQQRHVNRRIGPGA